MGWKDSFVAFDTETTGFGPKARIVEIAFVKFERADDFKDREGARWDLGCVNGYVPTEVFETLLNPDGVNFDDPGVKKAMEVNKIDPLDLADKPKFGDIVEDVGRFFDSNAIVAHNLPFDLEMLFNEFERVQPNISLFKPVHVDTLAADFGLSPGKKRRTLMHACGRWNVPISEAHRALNDTVMCGQLAAQMMNLLPDNQDELKSNMDSWSKEWGEICKRVRR